MRGSGKGISSSASSSGRIPEELEDMVLHQTMGANRIRSLSSRNGSHRLHRPTTSSSFSSSSTSSSSAPSISSSTVSSYLENLPSVTLSNTPPPPRPPRPPGGLLGISNGRGIGYGRSLGSSYDSPLTIHGSFNGHVRSGANLYGGKNQSSGLSPTKPSSGHHRPSLSVFPIQKALEIAMKESRLLQAASSRGASGTGMTTGITFVRELRRTRHAPAATLAAHGATAGNITNNSGDDGQKRRSAVQAVQELLDSYPAPSPYCVDEKKRSPLHFAAASGDLELVEFLLERGVRPDCGRDIAGNMPLHLAIISNRIDVVAALLKAGADMTLASPMTHKTPLDLAESRLSYLLSRAQETVKQSSTGTRPGVIDLFDGSISNQSNYNNNSLVVSRSNMHVPSTQSPALLYQIKGIVNLLRPYVVRQQRLQHGERQKERQKERLWDRADKYMRQQGSPTSSSGLWRVDALSDNDGDMEDEDELDEDDSQMDTTDRLLCSKAMSKLDMDGDVDLDHGGSIGFSTSRKHSSRRPDGRMDADEAEVALESLLSGLSLLEANQKQQQIQSSPSVTASQRSDVTDGNLADNELDPRNERDVEDALPDILEQVAHVLQAIKLNEVGE